MIRDFKIGADPEFGLLRDGDLVEASNVIDGGEDDRFGIDGGRRVAELRPDPSKDPLIVVSNIRRLLMEGVKKNPVVSTLDWKAGSMSGGHSIGGHIHFGVSNNRTGVGLRSWDKTCRILDIYLAFPLCLIDNPEEHRERIKYGYGQLSNYRDQQWGLEYRTIGSWLTSPYVAMGVLSLAKAVMWEITYNNISEDIDHVNTWMKFHGIYLSTKLSLIHELVQSKLWKSIKKFKLYPKLQQPIDLIGKLISEKKNWFPKCGMKAAWGIESSAMVNMLPKTSLAKIWR